MTVHPARGCYSQDGLADYFSELLIEPNLSFRLVPRPLTTVMIDSAIPAAISPYSIAVAAFFSAMKRLTKIIFYPCG